MNDHGFEDDEEIKAVYTKLNMIKNMDLNPPNPAYFSTLLARTRQRIEQEKTAGLWEKIFTFFQTPKIPIAALSIAMVLIVLLFSVSEIGDISLLRQKNIYSSLAQELELLGPHITHPEDDTLILEELNELNDEQLHNILNSLGT